MVESKENTRHNTRLVHGRNETGPPDVKDVNVGDVDLVVVVTTCKVLLCPKRGAQPPICKQNARLII